MSAFEHEKDMAATKEEKHSDSLERFETVYDDNFHGLTLKTILVYIVSCPLQNTLVYHDVTSSTQSAHQDVQFKRSLKPIH
jgi:hypothetical protein